MVLNLTRVPVLFPQAPQRPDLFLRPSPPETSPSAPPYEYMSPRLTAVPDPSYRGQRNIVALTIDRMLKTLEYPPHVSKLITPITQVRLPRSDVISTLAVLFDRHALFDATGEFISSLRTSLAWQDKRLVVHLDEDGTLAISKNGAMPAARQQRYRSGDPTTVTAASRDVSRILRWTYRFYNDGSVGEQIHRYACRMQKLLEAAHSDCRCPLKHTAAVYHDMRSILMCDFFIDAQRLELLAKLERRLMSFPFDKRVIF